MLTRIQLLYTMIWYLMSSKLESCNFTAIYMTLICLTRFTLYIVFFFKELKSRQNLFYRSAAPGAERKASTSMMVSSNGIADNW